ncbi:DNA polymerase III subunit epsilon [Rhabdochromatium marinum]|uniref:DNA polymerase III subunit epsilon n=1 Tax=Rhabdochromatium marinum TaxID=48729 RepID=UPI00190755E9|nr:DNA polymerase III subunit epsilon [Rhabdochromatium marinum]MBK1650167.1 DNA polymerase III subunit epsilon [Rhabdochromatium marinum]
MRQIVLDTETTGLEPSEGHRIIEIGCVELIDRRLTRGNFHQYLQPDRSVEAGAVEVHGLSDEFLADKPRFGDIAERFLNYIGGAQLIIHNAAFDLGFLNHELRRWREQAPSVESQCEVIDTLSLARRRHPGQRNSLDALCKRYGVDHSRRDLHGALLDAEILAEVYLAMTGGQGSLALDQEPVRHGDAQGAARVVRALAKDRPPLPVIRATEAELQAHQQRLAAIDKASQGRCVWLQPKTGCVS